MRIDSDQCSLWLNDTVGIRKVGRQILHRRLCRSLHIHVDGCIYLQTVLVDRIVSIFLCQLLENVVHKIGGTLAAIICVFRNMQRLLLCRCGFTVTDIAVLNHLIEHDSLALCRRIHIVDRRVIVRALWNPRKHGTLVERQILGILAKIGARRCLNTVGSLSKVDLVHVELKDFLLRILSFQLQREEYFLYLAL